VVATFAKTAKVGYPPYSFHYIAPGARDTHIIIIELAGNLRNVMEKPDVYY
jgi:hypothetical protein